MSRVKQIVVQKLKMFLKQLPILKTDVIINYPITMLITIVILSVEVHAIRIYGTDPFHQPNTTTLYWGSGDVNSDGAVTSADLTLAEKMASGSLESSCMADVNGDGIINTNDIAIFNQYLQKTIDYLPGWWNSLKSRDERKKWLLKAISTDKTDTLQYDSSWFKCDQFSKQTVLRLSGVPGTLNDNLIEAGQIGWNIPAYYASVNATVGHAINCVLIGENPLDFKDWYFFEPQDDSVVVPGAWNLKPGEISIESTIPRGKRIGGLPVVEFSLKNDLTCVLDSSSIDKRFITKRPDSLSGSIDNSLSEWRFKCVSNGNDFFICNRVRTDLSGNNDIYISDFDDTKNGYFPTSNRYTYLLDACKGTGSTLYLLWREKTVVNKPSLFVGTYDLAEKKFRAVTTLSDNGGYQYEGKLVFKDDTHLFVFWTENYGGSVADPDGIYSTVYNGITAAPYRRIFEFVKEHELEMSPCFFDATVTSNGDILFVTRNRNGIIFQKKYSSESQSWSESSIVSDTSEVVQDVDILTNTDGKIHLFYTDLDKTLIPKFMDASGVYQYSMLYDMFGKISHRVLSGDKWSAPEDAGLRELSSSPSAICAADGTMYLTFINCGDRDYNVVVNQNKNSTWKELFSVKSSNVNVPQWPRLHISSKNQLTALWETHNNDKVTISRKLVTSDPIYDGVKRSILNVNNSFCICKIGKNQINITRLQNTHSTLGVTISDLTGRILLKRVYADYKKTECIDIKRYSHSTLIIQVAHGSNTNSYRFVNSGL